MTRQPPSSAAGSIPSTKLLCTACSCCCCLLPLLLLVRAAPSGLLHTLCCLPKKLWPDLSQHSPFTFPKPGADLFLHQLGICCPGLTESCTGADGVLLQGADQLYCTGMSLGLGCCDKGCGSGQGLLQACTASRCGQSAGGLDILACIGASMMCLF